MGKFKPGQSKPDSSGRKKGTPNKKSRILEEILESNNFNIPEQLIKLLPNLSPEKQADTLLDLMSYIYPKRKAVEISEERPPEDNTIEIILVSPNGDRRNLNEIRG